jgi:hypothetical protein
MVCITARRRAVAAATLAALLTALLALTTATASGPVWLPTVRAAHLPSRYVALALATYRNHAYVLSTRLDPTRSDVPVGVSVTTNESGAWTTRLLSAKAPLQLIEENQTSLALDPGTRRLYAAWAYNARPGYDTIGVWTRDVAGTWRGPRAISTLSSEGPASVVAAQGKVYVAFTAQEDASSAPCHNSRTDVFVTAYDGSTWSAPQNVTNCISGLADGDTFYAPRLALDGSHLYLTSANASHATWDLWYLDKAGGTWSRPVQITHRRENDLYHYDYSIAASEGTAYVAYTAYTGVQGGGTFGHHDVFLATHALGGAWTVRDVTKEPYDCDKYAPALVARAGRLGLAYVFADVNSGACGSSSAASEPFKGVHLLTGTPGHWVEAPLTRGNDNAKASPALSSDGDLFRVVYSNPVDNAGSATTNVFYKPEFLDVVGPTTHLSVPATVTAPSIRIRWSAQDPTPGSGVAHCVVQVRDGAGPWQDLTPQGTRSTFLVYAHLQSGHRYTFRVRARDKVNNWGAWVSAGTHAS